MTDNLIAASDFFAAIGLVRGVDWEVGRADDGTPLAMPKTAEAASRIDAAMDAAVGCLGGRWEYA